MTVAFGVDPVAVDLASELPASLAQVDNASQPGLFEASMLKVA